MLRPPKLTLLFLTCHVLDVIVTDNYQNQCQFVDTDNITLRSKEKMLLTNVFIDPWRYISPSYFMHGILYNYSLLTRLIHVFIDLMKVNQQSIKYEGDIYLHGSIKTFVSNIFSFDLRVILTFNRSIKTCIDLVKRQ
jgi:hypothetical protein